MNKIMHTTEYENIYFDFENVKHPEIKFYADDSHPYVRELENLNRSLAKSSGNQTFDRGYPVEAHQRREVLERLGQLYVGLQRYAEAVAIYERLLEHVDRPYTRFRLAVAVGLDGNYKRAIQLLESVRAERPDAVVVYSKLGWAYALDGNDRLALSFYNQALALDSFDLFSLFELGKYYYMTGDRRRAREFFQRVLDADKQGNYADRVRELTGPAV